MLVQGTTQRESISLLLDGLRNSTGSDFAGFFTCRVQRDAQCYTRVVVSGDAALGACIGGLDGRPLIPCSWNDPTRPPPGEVNRVVRPTGPVRRCEAWQRVYAPFEVGDQMRALLYDGAQHFVGWLGVMRRGRAVRYTACDVHLLQGQLGALRGTLAGAGAWFSGEGEFALVRPDGHLEHATAAAAAWLSAQRLERVRVLVARLERDADARSEQLVDAVRLRCVRLDATGSLRYLVQLLPEAPPRCTAVSRLTARQQEIARFAAAGATVDEIATALSISPNTVKHHLKCIYRGLGVASRVELADALEDAS